MDYHYDNQLRRYLLQFLRIFSDIKVRSAPNANGNSLETRVPVKYGDMSRMVASIINNNTENVTLTAPAMAGYITNIKLAPKRRADTMLTTKVQASEAKFNAQTNEYEPAIGNQYTVERYMPVPYDLTMKLDILTTNTDSKLQILEQIMTVFNPSIQLTQNDNPLDWSNIFEVELTDVTWSNRNIPVGNNLQYDVASLQFNVPVWINPPAKETRQRIIDKIIIKVFDSDGCVDDVTDSDLITQLNITPDNLKILVEDHPSNPLYNLVTLLNAHGGYDQNITWENQIGIFGTIDPLTSLLKLKTNDNLDSTAGDIYATVIGLDSNKSTMIVQVTTDTLPANIAGGPVTRIIDPTKQFPNIQLPAPATGQRYLLLLSEQNDDNAIIAANSHWGGITAKQHDIIEYNGSIWIISFDSDTEPAGQYVVDLSNSIQYKFDGSEWIYSYLGEYTPAYWSIENVNIQ